MKEIERRFTLDIDSIDREAMTINGASLSSDAPVEHWIDGELRAVELVHDAEAVTLPRSIPLLWQHDMSQPIGKIDNLTIRDGKIRGRFNFSRNSKAQDVWRDVQDGFLTDTSVKAIPDEWEDEDEAIRVTRWSLIEGSVVTIGADQSVGLNRSQQQEGNAMTDETVTRESGTAGQGSGETKVVDYQAARERAKAAGVIEGQKLERQRIDEIDALFAGPGYAADEFQGLKRHLISNGDSIEVARGQLLELIGQGTAPAASGDFRQIGGAIPRNGGGTTDGEKFAQGMERALAVRVGIEKDKEAIREVRENEFANMTITEMAREFCRRNQIGISGLNREQIVGIAMADPRPSFAREVMGHSTSDFANVLENIATKSLLRGWEMAEETWQEWCRIGSLPDFKQASRTGLSSFSDLDLIYENGEYKEGTRSDLKENIQLLTYGKLMSISRQALANDDLAALSTTPQAMGMKANRKIGDLAYDLLYQNSGVGPTLNQDSLALWHATHGNYIASGSGAAPSVTTVEAARTALATMTDPGGETMSMPLSGWTLLVPWALAGTANVLMAAEYNPAEGTTTSFREPNSVRGAAKVVTDARLDANLATAWYLLANPNIADTFEVAFLNGQQTPYLEQQQGFRTDGVTYKVRIDCAVAALDFRRVYKNYGA